MNDYLKIIGRNFYSPIVIAILILALVLLILNEQRDAWFLSVVITVNTLIAIVQEIRASIALKKLELMNAPRATIVLSDGKTREVSFEQLVVGDVIKVKMGDEVPADCRLLSTSGIEVDESILTGESIPIEKSVHSVIHAASQVVSGSATAQVVAVGSLTRVGTMTSKLKSYKPELTPMQREISRAISFLTFGAIGLAGLIIVVYSLSGETAVKIFKTVASAAVTVVPEGLLLASSLLLAFGSLKLARAKVLPQKISAIEAMAQLNVLCVDKTGTLTDEKIVFEGLEVVDKNISNLSELVAIAAKETSNGSATNEAITNALQPTSDYQILETLPFSSSRKMSGVSIKTDNKAVGIIVGAPEYVAKIASVDKKTLNRIAKQSKLGKRVLLVALVESDNISIKKIEGVALRAVGIITLANELRQGVKETVDYLQKNGVKIKVISGDNPDTVGYIAVQAGIKDADKIITGIELQSVPDGRWDKTVARTTIFARVLPEQKERLIETYKRLGNYTGMVGDGVNDALALKKSDLGVAMYAGAAASRRVADIVILDNSFNSLPLGMRLGNRIMQAIEIIATLFFHKIIFGVVLLASTLLIGLVYPFEPRHVTFMNIFLVTIPTVLWTIFPPIPRRRINPKRFWHSTLLAVSPIAFLSGFMVTITYAFLSVLHPGDATGVSTTTVMVATFFGIYLVFLVPKMFDVKNNHKAKIARWMYVLSVLVVMVPSFGYGFIRDFFNFSTPAWQSAWPLMVVLLGVAIVQWRIAKVAGKKVEKA